MMVSAHYPLIGIHRARNSDHDIVKSFDIPVRLHFQMDLSGARSYVIREGQATAPGLGPYRSLQSFKQILCVSVGSRKNRDASEGLHMLQSQTLCVLRSSYVRGGRSVGMNGDSLYAAALHSIWW